jgi:hypothetical protein
MEGHKKMFFIKILKDVEVEVVKLHFEVNTKARMLDIIKMKVNFMEVDEETLEEEEVVEVVVEVIKVNDQIATRTTIIMGNLGTWLKNYYQREHDARNEKLQQGNYALTNNQNDEQLFLMQHMANSMIGGVSDNNV